MTAEPITVTREGTVTVVSVHGEHDVFTAPSLRSAVNDPLGEGTPVVVDLRAATFIDSSVLAVLLGGLRRAREAGLGYAIVLEEDAERPVRRIFDVTGLVPVFPLFPNLPDAVSAATPADG